MLGWKTCVLLKASEHLFELIIDNTYINIFGVHDFWKFMNLEKFSCDLQADSKSLNDKASTEL